MAKRFINELRAGDQLPGEVFQIRSKDLRTTTQGGLYIHAVLTDRSGQIVARQWQATEEGFRAMPEGGFLRFKGRVESYKGNPQFIIDAMQPVEDGGFELGDFLPASTKDVAQMRSRLEAILQGIKHDELKALIGEFLADEGLMAAFCRAPAAAVMHHAYLGGLLEHTLNVLELALLIVPRYPQLNMDLVLAGVFLHDIGKSAELSFETGIGYTDEGQLLGHIMIAANWIQQKADRIAARRGKPFPDAVRAALQHIVLSHHGRYEFGSPKLPAMPEAIAVHHLDNLDAKVAMLVGEIEHDPDAVTHWTNYSKALETKVYKLDVDGRRRV